MNTGLKIYIIPLPLASLALLLSLALVIVDLAIFYAFMTIRMLLLSALRALCFNDANIIDFIEKYEETYNDFNIFKDDRFIKLFRYYDNFRKEIKDSIAFLREFAMQERDINDLKNYCRTFFRVFERLTLMHLLSKTEQSRLFFFGLLVGIRNKTIKHYKVDELDLNSYAAFDDFAAFAFKTDQSAKTIEAINRKKSFLTNFTKDIRTLVKEHTELASVLKSAKKALVVMPFIREPRFTNEKKEINKFDSKTATKPLSNIPLKMLEVKSASEEKFRLLLSATDYKDEEEEEVKDTGARCKIIAFAKTPETQLKLFINTEMSIRLLKICIKVASVEINAAAKDKAKKPFQPSEGSKPIKIKKNVRQQREKNYGTLKAHSKDKLFDSLIKKESSRPSGPTKADEAIEDMEREVEIIQRVSKGRKKKTYKREKFIDLYVTIKA
ncbi:hypothetical protein MBM_06903 [Drepanopeziza brunnea f. sp. 'multigermtubi' MB_m1]|uniref:Uncharacterized protein n=1 Tax=Marssonina brunnea f. sp. multigermtubi (strain MB_m1) TaxID=1072389 RepID=K1WS27_MARBU|nr:uncharacterized protein MBM_06903 [Drepanopeziza brunnea f. sp. 'multigermtubi' MB_m1]EKD15142.1 hypothetical protein MBM_06903 [Drepanopeziza brunnea f. sp. 'multigermtubi' MB_m1]